MKAQLSATILCLGLTVAWVPQHAFSQIVVDGTATPIGGGSFQYAFSVTNNGVDDVSLVSLTDAPTSDASIGATLTAPSGFLASYDPGLGIVDFLEDTDLFGAGTTKGNFQFESSGDPGFFFSLFEALTTVGDPLDGFVNLIVVPEPSVVWTAGALLMLVVLPAIKRIHSRIAPNR